MPVVDLSPNHTIERPVPNAVVSEVKAPETEARSGYWIPGARAVFGEALIVLVDESGPPVDEYRIVRPPVVDDHEFDPVIPFKPDGVMRAKLAEEAPDFEVEWDF